MHVWHVQTDVVVQRAYVQVCQRRYDFVLIAEDVAFDFQGIVYHHGFACGIVIFRPYLTRQARISRAGEIGPHLLHGGRKFRIDVVSRIPVLAQIAENIRQINRMAGTPVWQR